MMVPLEHKVPLVEHKVLLVPQVLKVRLELKVLPVVAVVVRVHKVLKDTKV